MIARLRLWGLVFDMIDKTILYLISMILVASGAASVPLVDLGLPYLVIPPLLILVGLMGAFISLKGVR